MDLNENIPDLTLPDLSGNLYRLSDFRGRVTIFSFWSAECPHCERTDALILAAAERAGAAAVAIAPNRNESEAVLAAAAQARQLPLVLLDRYDQAADAFDASITPEVFVVDRAGIVRYRGAVDDVTWQQPGAARHFLEDAVQALLNKRIPSPAATMPFGCAIVRYI